jgi:predicted DNA-binding protein (MmcQ/YjbR family)
MIIEDIQSICKKWPGVTEDIKWGHDLVFSVGAKMFCVVGLDQSPVSASFKVGEDVFDEISSRPGFKPAPYMAKHKWVWVDDIARIKKSEWKSLLQESYQLVKTKLPAKTQQQIDSLR